jgi:ATP-dependent DNA helicase RecQ
VAQTGQISRENAPNISESVQIDRSENEGLFDELRALRRDLASSEGVPPYIVFSDKALTAMCNALPGTEGEFLSIPGVGTAKLEKYGVAFLRAIAKWRDLN